MALKVCVAPTHLLWNTALGGHAWVFLNWALGLQENGCEVVLLEKAKYTEDPSKLATHLTWFCEQMAELGLRARVSLIAADGNQSSLDSFSAEVAQLLVPLDQVIDESDDSQII